MSRNVTIQLDSTYQHSRNIKFMTTKYSTNKSGMRYTVSSALRPIQETRVFNINSFFDERPRVSYFSHNKEILEENEEIKKKLTEYHQYTNKSNDKVYDTTSTIICKKLKSQNAQINQLLSRQVATKNIMVNVKETISISPFSSYYGKIVCKNQPIPLAIHITVNQGLNSVYLYFSSIMPNPSKDYNEKAIKLKKQKLIATLYDKDRMFSYDWIYIAFEAEEKANIMFECSFGKGALMRDSLEKSFGVARGFNTTNEIDALLRDIRRDPEKIKKCNETARKIIAKRQLRVLSMMKRTRKKEVNTSLQLKTVYAKWKRASLSRARIEEVSLMRKFIISHKKEIWNKFVLRISHIDFVDG